MTLAKPAPEGPEIAPVRFSEEDWDALNALTGKQRAFVLEYPKDMNGTRAAGRAGYAGNVETWQVMGSRLLRHPKVNYLIRKLTAATADEMGITREWLLKEVQDTAARLEERGDSPVPALSLLARLRGDLIERVDVTSRSLVVTVNGVDAKELM